MDAESGTSHVLIAHYTFLGCPLESSFHGIFDFIQELNTLSNINDNVCSCGIWTEAPDLRSISLVPLEVIDKDS